MGLNKPKDDVGFPEIGGPRAKNEKAVVDNRFPGLGGLDPSLLRHGLEIPTPITLNAMRSADRPAEESLGQDPYSIKPKALLDFRKKLGGPANPYDLEDSFLSDKATVEGRWRFMNALLHKGKANELFTDPNLAVKMNTVTPNVWAAHMAGVVLDGTGTNDYTREKVEYMAQKIANIYGHEGKDYIHDVSKFCLEGVSSKEFSGGKIFLWPQFLQRGGFDEEYRLGREIPRFFGDRNINDRVDDLKASRAYYASWEASKDRYSKEGKVAGVAAEWNSNRLAHPNAGAGFVIDEFVYFYKYILPSERDFLIRGIFEPYSNGDPCGLEFFRLIQLFESGDKSLKEDFTKRFYKIMSEGDGNLFFVGHLQNIIRFGPIHSASLAIKVLAEFYQNFGNVSGNVTMFVDNIIDDEEDLASQDIALKLFYFASYFENSRVEEVVFHLCKSLLTNVKIWPVLLKDGFLEQKDDYGLAEWLNGLQRKHVLFRSLDPSILMRTAKKVSSNDESARKEFPGVLGNTLINEDFDFGKAIEDLRGAGYWSSKHPISLRGLIYNSPIEFFMEPLPKDNRASSFKIKMRFQGLAGRRYLNGVFFANIVDGKLRETDVPVKKSDKDYLEKICIVIAHCFAKANAGWFVDKPPVEEPESKPEVVSTVAVEPEVVPEEPAEELEPVTESEPAAEPEVEPETEQEVLIESEIGSESELASTEEPLLNLNDFKDPEDEFKEKSDEVQTFINKNNDGVSRLISEGANFEGDFSDVFLFRRREMELDKKGKPRSYWYERCKPEELKEIVARGAILSEDLYVPIIAPHLSACGYYPSTKTVCFEDSKGRRSMRILRTLTRKEPSDDAILAHLYHDESGMPSVGKMEPREAYLRVGVRDYEESDKMEVLRRKKIFAVNKKVPLMRRGFTEKIVQTLQDDEWREGFVLSKIAEIDREIIWAQKEIAAIEAEIETNPEKEEDLLKKISLLLDEISRMEEEKECIPVFWNDIARKSEVSNVGEVTGVPFLDRVHVHAAVTRAISNVTFNQGSFMAIKNFAENANSQV